MQEKDVTTKADERRVEFERQVQNMLTSDYPKFAGISEKQLRELAHPLLDKLESIENEHVGNILFVIVVRNALVSSEEAMSKVVINKQRGSVITTPVKSSDFKEIESITTPDAQMYLLTDINTGREFLNVSPENCLKIIHEQGRTPLTLDEGVALVTQFPEVLTDNERYNCIQMPGSRIIGDQRVPSIWMSYKKPRLGWCWNRNVHTWLGSASAKHRLG